MTSTEVKKICQDYQVKPSKAAGQNFLLDENVVKKIITAAKMSPASIILEVGPGLGILTSQLLATAGTVIAVELDRRLFGYLSNKFKKEISTGHLKLVNQDIFKIKLADLGLVDFNYQVVANLPYSVTSLFFRNFLEQSPKPSKITVMIQSEVAKRLVSPPGEMNLLALSAQLFGEPKIDFLVPPASFWPEPAVESAVISIKVKQQLPAIDIRQLFRLAKSGFGAKRKQLHNNLAGYLKIDNQAVKDIFKQFGWREDIRAQDLSVEDWVELTQEIKKIIN